MSYKLLLFNTKDSIFMGDCIICPGEREFQESESTLGEDSKDYTLALDSEYPSYKIKAKLHQIQQL